MTVKSLELGFFRNYPHLKAEFDPRVNLVYGDNAQGKTNLLEAVAYLSAARSHRARYDREMIMLGLMKSVCILISCDSIQQNLPLLIQGKIAHKFPIGHSLSQHVRVQYSETAAE